MDSFVAIWREASLEWIQKRNIDLETEENEKAS